jgi:acetoin utilization protein AcuB
MQVRDIMRGSVVSVAPDDALALAVQLMLWNGVRHLPVVRDGSVVGILSERDVLGRGGGEGSHFAGTVAEVMTSEPQTIDPQAELEDAAARLCVHKHGSLPVVEDGRLVGIITTTDVLAHTAQVRLEPPAAGGLLDRDVESVMTAKVAAVFEDDPLVEAAARMRQHGIRHLPVVDGLRRVVGIVSERDLLGTAGHLREASEDPSARVQAMRVRDVMVAEPRTVRPGDTLAHVVGILAHERFGALPVVDDDHVLQGMVSYVDVLMALRAVS